MFERTPSKSVLRRAVGVTYLLVGASFATLGCSDNCIDGCPAPRSLAPCTGAVPTLTVDALIADPTPRVGTLVSVRGTLAHEGAICTQLGCFDGCCNSCGARLVIAGTAGHQLPLASNDSDLTCGGDESRICCPLREGTAIAVQGLFQKEMDTINGPTFLLDQAVLCARPE